MSDWTEHFSEEERTGKKPIENRNFSGCDLTCARLVNTTLMNCNFTNATLRDANLDGTKLFGCDWNGVDASGCRAVGTSFVDVTWRGGRAAGADLAKSDFTRVDLRDGDLSSAILRGASFDESNLMNLNLRGADLGRRARLTATDLRASNVDGVTFGDTTLENCAVHGMKGSPREPYDVSVFDADLSAQNDHSRVVGWAELAELWRAQRSPDPRRAPFELGPPVVDADLPSTLLVLILEQNPDLDAVFEATPRVFRALVPWFKRIPVYALYASRAETPRLVYAAQLGPEQVELFEGSPERLTTAAVAESLRISDDDAARYAHFGYHVTRGAAAGAAWNAPERVEQTPLGWTVHVSTTVGDKVVSNRILIGRDGSFACKET